MVLPKELFKEALIAVHHGLAGAHLGRMKILKKIKARFWKSGLTRGVHKYCSAILDLAPEHPYIQYHRGTQCKESTSTYFFFDNLTLYLSSEEDTFGSKKLQKKEIISSGKTLS